MSAKHALLGLLIDRAGYPYQLADRLQERLGPAWEVNSGQLYQTVKALERDGLIERVPSEAGSHEDRHVYEITGAGVDEFERWFDEAPDTVRLPRRPLLLKITFAGPRRLRDAMAKIDAYEYECAQRLKAIARVREALPAQGELVRADRLLLRLNLSTDIFQLEGELRWARDAREMLTWLATQEAIWPSERERSDAHAPSDRRDGRSARKALFTRMAGSEPDTSTD